MFLEKETYDSYGYYIHNLTEQSNKDVLVKCDYCNIHYISTKKRIILARKSLSKDACASCRFKKREEVSLLRDGIKNSAQRQDVKNKISNSNSDRLKSDEYKNSIKKINMQKYGVEHPMQCDDIKDKHRKTLIKKYGVYNAMQIDGVAKNAAKKMLSTKIEKGLIKVYNYKTMPELAEDKGFSRSHFTKLVKKYGLEYALNATPLQSNLEKLFEDWLQEIGINYKKQYRVANYIADFKIDNLLIELDGLYWHSDAAKLDKNYHSNKRKVYIENGFIPLFFRENELINKFDIVKSIILNKLNKSNKIFARKCKVIELDNNEFLIKNHLMGRGYGRIFALSYNNTIVSVMQVRRLTGDDYEISRFCHLASTNVIGGFSKLLKHVEKTIKMNSLKTFIDLRYGQGSYLTDYGFKHKHTYNSFYWTNGKDVFHRLKFRGNSGYENRLYKIWDCGQSAFIKYYL